MLKLKKKKQLSRKKLTDWLEVGEDIFGGCLTRTMYEKILAKRLTFQGSFNIMKKLVRFMTLCKKMKLTEDQIEGENWRILVRTGQMYFPTKERKEISKRMCLGIRVVVFRLDEETLIKRFDNNILPILGKKDPLTHYVIRGSHTGSSLFQKVHKPIHFSIRSLTRGKFRDLIPEARTFLKLIRSTCTRGFVEFPVEAQISSVFILA